MSNLEVYNPATELKRTGGRREAVAQVFARWDFTDFFWVYLRKNCATAGEGRVIAPEQDDGWTLSEVIGADIILESNVDTNG